ncbi:glycosyltransferase family 2 protein [Niabella aquatica]
MYPLLSVVIPTCQRPGLLLRCLKALSHQTLQQTLFEVIIVSDGPETATAVLVNNFREMAAIQITYMALPRKSGPAAARNAGWINARGRYIAFTDDDCLPRPQWLKTIVEAFESCTGQAFYGKVKVPVSEPPTDFEWNTKQLEKPQFITANAACTKALLLSTGGFDERYRTAWREDSDLEFALRQRGIIPRFLPGAIVIHPVRSAAWGVSIKEQKKAIYNALLYKKYPSYYKKYIHQVVPLIYYVMVLASVSAIIFFVIKKNNLAFISLLVWAFCFTAFIIKRLRHKTHTFFHITEMICTSACIPFCSVYWNWAGWRKFKNVSTLQN